jgi:hypothetical protein
MAGARKRGIAVSPILRTRRFRSTNLARSVTIAIFVLAALVVAGSTWPDELLALVGWILFVFGSILAIGGILFVAGLIFGVGFRVGGK